MTKKILYSVFALALLSSTVGCPPPAPPADVDTDISTEPVEVTNDNVTGITEVPSDNLTTGSETP